ncbi:hypothetical protein D1012_14145 [Pseudotabrizicola alkalilacus]|uniref:Uncharacterized protein n=1 Tax=Pseudotabrizicola alkalilacus TaxID=2305252 RepID=A0A411Z160_9RHOB|nr:hypothetical protein D1012_14145 [Pseudotabrizicola alkalilacus]
MSNGMAILKIVIYALVPWLMKHLWSMGLHPKVVLSGEIYASFVPISRLQALDGVRRSFIVAQRKAFGNLLLGAPQQKI